MNARMQFCLHPAHSYSNEDKAGAWFFSPTPSRYCPQHQTKPRGRMVNGQFVPVCQRMDEIVARLGVT
jgi:hypothetical protein